MEYESRTIEDHYLLDLQIPANYPESPPFVFETEGKIPKDFDHFMVAGDFCLGAPIEVRRRFAGHKNLLRFIEDQVIPYLFTYSYKRVHGELPFGDLRHGTEGLLQYYTEFFGTSPVEAMELLKCLADDSCPAAHGVPVWRRAQATGLPRPETYGTATPSGRPTQFEIELRDMIKLVRAAGIRFPESKVIPKRMKQRERQWRKKSKRKR